MAKLKDELKRYNETVLDHFMNPRNVGDVSDATVRASASNPQCQDVVRYALRVEEGRIREIRMKTFGCTISIASASAITELAGGATIDEARKVGRDQVVEKLGGIPAEKLRCTTAACEALQTALKQLTKA